MRARVEARRATTRASMGDARWERRSAPRARVTPSRGVHGASRAVDARAVDARAVSRRSASGEDAVESDLTFWGKMHMAYRIFFPPSALDTARMEAKKRLRMILVADRCTMSETSMDAMKMKIMDVVGEFVDVDEAQEVDVSMNTDEEFGTMYAVSIPVKRVKA